jgi:aminoglycoside phosphotransferase (APT) family kinase protein
MSIMATATSTRGVLAIHYNPTPVPEQTRQHVAYKINAITAYLRKYAEDVPVQETIATHEFADSSYYIVQTYLPGNRLGQRTIEDGQIVETYLIEQANIPAVHAKVDRYTGRLHSLPMSGYGFLTANDTSVSGEEESWSNFLQNGSARWMEVFKTTSTDSTFIDRVAHVENLLAQLFANHADILGLQQGYFVHGDIVNLSNVLVQDNEVTGIIDFEWSISGDPAWEFSHTEVRPGASYYEVRGISSDAEKARFLRSVDFCTIFWSLWGAHVHAPNDAHGIKDLLFRRAERYLDIVSSW